MYWFALLPQCMKVTLLTALPTAFLVILFLIFTSMIGEKVYYSVVLICISIIVSEVEESFINLKRDFY